MARFSSSIHGQLEHQVEKTSPPEKLPRDLLGLNEDEAKRGGAPDADPFVGPPAICECRATGCPTVKHASQPQSGGRTHLTASAAGGAR